MIFLVRISFPMLPAIGCLIGRLYLAAVCATVAGTFAFFPFQQKIDGTADLEAA